jgi:hypothetical protein
MARSGPAARVVAALPKRIYDVAREDDGGTLAFGCAVKAGDRVRLRPPAEILRTLDDEGRMDGLPFMPEMLQFLGGTYTVQAQVRRACDTIGYSGVRHIRETVILDDLRCDGSGHAGCQNQCRIYWKEAWLEPAAAPAQPVAEDDPALLELRRRSVLGATHPDSTPEEPRYRSQATELLTAGDAVPWWSLGSFVGELTSGNVGPVRWVTMMFRIVGQEVARRVGLISNLPFREHRLTGGTGAAAKVEPTLKPGDLVQIRPKGEIAQTLNREGKNRGLWFDREMVAHCGRTATVKAQIEHFIDERTGKMIDLKTDCYILDDVICPAERSNGRWFCPRAIYPWWREAWLERVESAGAAEAPDA